MFNLLRSVVTSENYNRVVNACEGVAAMVRSTSTQDYRVQTISAAKLNTLVKCDSSYTFSLYTDGANNPKYFLIYLPRSLCLQQSTNVSQLKLIQQRLIALKVVVSELERENSNAFNTQMESLRTSVEINEAYGDIHHAAACGFQKVIGRLCSSSDAINTYTVGGKLPVHIAIENGQVEAVALLMKLGADPSMKDDREKNSIHHAASQDNVEILKILSSAGNFRVIIDQIDAEGMSPLCHAVLSSKADCVDFLLRSGCSLGPFPAGTLVEIFTQTAPSSQSARIMDILAKRSPGFLTDKTADSSTILHKDLNPSSFYKILTDLTDGLNLDARNARGETPLCCAVSRQNLKQVMALLIAGAQTSIADNCGNTPLHIAVKLESPVITKLLLCFNAPTNVENKEGITPIGMCKKDRKDILECLRLMNNPPACEPSPERS